MLECTIWSLITEYFIFSERIAPIKPLQYWILRKIKLHDISCKHIYVLVKFVLKSLKHFSRKYNTLGYLFRAVVNDVLWDIYIYKWKQKKNTVRTLAIPIPLEGIKNARANILQSAFIRSSFCGPTMISTITPSMVSTSSTASVAAEIAIGIMILSDNVMCAVSTSARAQASPLRDVPSPQRPRWSSHHQQQQAVLLLVCGPMIAVLPRHDGFPDTYCAHCNIPRTGYEIYVARDISRSRIAALQIKPYRLHFIRLLVFRSAAWPRQKRLALRLQCAVGS